MALAFETANDKEGVILVTVADDVCEMARDKPHKSTKPFANIRTADGAKEGGELSLPLTKAIVEVGHEGSLSFVSDGVGEGVTATIRVPVQWTDRTDGTRPNTESPLWWVAPQDGATADVLVVDDVKLNRMAVAFKAKKMGLSVEQAADGAEAVELLKTNTYSMVFMDQQMPVMKGDVATEKARANGYSLPIVMVSSDPFSPDQRIALKGQGITAFLDKGAIPGTYEAMESLRGSMQSEN